MKRSTYFSIVAVALAVLLLALLGNRIVGRTLDAQLANLLTRELGIPVTLAPLNASVLQLTARSSKLVMGDPNNPAIVATEVEVSVDLSDLLKRKIRLASASADDLMVRPSRWPGSDSPWPDNYEFLEQWLPGSLRLNTARYEADNGDTYPLKQVAWQRDSGGGAQLAWTEERGQATVTSTIELKSLADLLQMSRLQSTLGIFAAGKKNSKLTLTTDLKPGETSGYSLETHIQAAGMQVHVLAGNSRPWELPIESTTIIDTLDIGRLRELVGSYTGRLATEQDTLLASALPKLSLPDHRGSIAISEIRLDDEVTRDNSFKFTTAPQGVNNFSLTATGPSGILKGGFSIASSDQGWQLDLSAQLTAREPSQSLAAQYLSSDWLWRSGHTRLAAKGDTWGALLYSMSGEVTLAGSHRDKVQTPVSIDARLDNRPGDFALENILVKVGDGLIKGSAILSGEQQRKLGLKLTAEDLNLDFLFTETAAASAPGVALPEFLDALPGMDIDWELAVNGLDAPGISLSAAQARGTRANEQGQVIAQATGRSGGRLDLRLDASLPEGKPNDVTLDIKLEKIDLAQLFQQENPLLQGRNTGTISFEGHGEGVDEVFKSMRGKASLTVEIRNDNNWQRASAAGEQLQFSGNAKLVIDGTQMVGLRISELAIESIQQNLTGTLSMFADRTPWLIADLESDKLDIDGLMELTPPTAGNTDQLKSIRELDPVRLSLDAKSLILMGQPLSKLQLEISSAPGSFTLDKLDFDLSGGRLTNRAEIKWLKDKAEFEANSTASDFGLDRFLMHGSTAPPVPVSGSLKLNSSGSTIEELLVNLVGNVDLEASSSGKDTSPASRRKLKMTARQLADGMQASIDKFQWGENELSGSVRYHKTAPPRWDVAINDGALSLLPWESATPTAAAKSKGKRTDSPISRAAKTSADMVSSALMAPIRLLGKPREAAPGQKLFSSKPLPLATLNKYHVDIKGRLGSLTSSIADARDLELSASINAGRLRMQTKVGQLNQGSGEMQLLYDSTVTPPTAELTGSFENIHAKQPGKSYPRSAYFSLTSQGQSQAELAANLNGLLYLQFGQGPLDYRNARLLTTSVATSMFETLIPGVGKKQPQLQCGTTLATFKDGIGTTPYGYAARTDQANLVGRIAVDLKKEMIQLEFDSRSRKGVGISIGSVFSNTVQVSGPLTHPRIVPNKVGLLWRGAAAFMTAGLSVVGESVYKRTLASSDPCSAVNKEIRKNLCGTDQPAASSPLVCPPEA